MVLDEELKTMAALCPQGRRVHSPRLKEMAHLAHTEYHLRGACPLEGPEVLRRSMFAPTVTGSPLRNACQVIARRKPAGRGYYSGVAALMGRDRDGRSTLDSTILIRTADVSETGRLRLGVGATIVRHSQPALESAETRTKAKGVLQAFRDPDPRTRPAGRTRVPSTHRTTGRTHSPLPRSASTLA
ncbi:chorismate-binding protein [Streptomyces sp. NPDC002306]